MSQLASQYYAEIGDTVGMQVPTVLDGNEHALVDADFRLSIHMLKDPSYQDVQRPLWIAASAAIDAVSEFMLNVKKAHYPNATIKASVSTSQYETSINKLFGDLTSSKQKTGRLTDFKFEAVSPDEVPDDVAKYYEQHKIRSGTELTLGIVSLLATAKLFSGRPLGIVGKVVRLSVIAEHNETGRVESMYAPVRLQSRRLKSNELVSLVGLAIARQKSSAIEANNVSKPYVGGLSRSG